MRTRRFPAPLFFVAVVTLFGCKPDTQTFETADEIAAKTAPDGSWVALTGRVIDDGPDSFSLDYGGGTILVEFDDRDWFPEGSNVLENDEVIVYGYIDDDFYEQRKIEASSVYVKNLGTQFYASGVDEEDFPAVSVIDFRPRIEVKGKVASVSGDEFELDTGVGVVEVETDAMAYDPLDAEGFQKLEPGDRVLVIGRLEPDLFSEMDLIADTVVSLKSTTKAGS